MSLKTCCSHHLRTAGWIGTRRPSWPLHALYLRRTSMKTSWVGALYGTYWVGAMDRAGIWLLMLSNGEDSWSAGTHWWCWIKSVYYPNARHILYRLLASSKKKVWNILKLISFKDELEACGNQLLFFAAISPVFLLSCGLVLTALVCPLWWACHRWDNVNSLKT